MKPTTTELRTLRTRPHRTKLWLSIYKPQTIMACQVSDIELPEWPVGRGSFRIYYKNVTSGGYLSVESGMTMYIGTTAGAWDVGRIRVRSANASYITVAENDDIDWKALHYLTIVRYWEIWPVYPRLVQDDEDVTFYKDLDITYTDQNSNYGQFINMGPHGMAFINPDLGYAQIYYTASGTYNLMGRGMTYDWAFEGGDPTGSTLNTPGWVQYDTPGFYTTRLTVTDASGTVDKSYRHMAVYDTLGYGTNLPILGWGLNSLAGSREEGGYTAQIWVRDTVDYLVDGMLVVIRSENWYGETKTSIGGNALNRPGTFFVGYITAGSIQRNYRDSLVEFEARSPTGIMEMMEGFSVSVEGKYAPAYWYEALDMDCRRALYHYLRWHSTLLMTNDFEFVGTDQRIQYFDADRTSLYDAIQSLMDGTLMGDIVCDRQGKVWSEIDVSATAGATGTFQTSFEMDKEDWVGDPTVEERQINDVSYLELGGIYYGGPQPNPKNDVSTPLMAAAPGDAPSYRGSQERRQGLALGSQAQLNTLVGNVFAFRNSRYPESTYDLSGNYSIIDIAPQELIKITLTADDTPRGIAFTKKPFVTRGMEWRFDSRLGLLLPTIHVAEVTTGIVGEAMVVPEPPDDGFDQPPIPPIPPLPPPVSFGIGAGNYWVHPFNGSSVITYLNMPDAATTYGRTTFFIPAGTTSALFTPYIVGGDATGHARMQHVINAAKVGDASFVEVGNTTEDISLTLNEYGPNAICPLTLNGYGGYLCQILVARLGAHANDDYEGDVEWYGITVDVA